MIIGIFATVGLLFLILDTSTALSGGLEGVDLCLKVLIPSLFPFFVLTNLLSSTLIGKEFRILRPLELILRIPKGTGTIFLAGLLGGYPTGAQLIHQSWKTHQLSYDTANRMLTFCSNAGPSFLFGVIALKFQRAGIVWLLWAIHILTAVIVSKIIQCDRIPSSVKLEQNQSSFTNCIRLSITVMASVCAWVVVFRILIAFISRWFLWMLPTEVQVILISLLELANGCSYLEQIENEGLRIILCSLALNFGGICVMMQTASVTQGLQLRHYIKGKLLQTALACYFTALMQQILLEKGENIQFHMAFYFLYPLTVFCCIYFLKKRKNVIAFRGRLLYNHPINQ